MHTISLLSLLYACNNDIANEYAERKSALLAAAPTLPADWQPDIVLRLTYPHLSSMGQELINQHLQTMKPFTKSLMGVSLQLIPKLRLTTLTLSDVPNSEHMKIEGSIQGPWRWNVAGVKGKEKSTIHFAGEVNTIFENGQILLKIDRIERLDMNINDIKIGLLQSVNIEKIVKDWLKEEILQTPPIPIGSIDLPVRGVKLHSQPNAQHIDIRSHVNHRQNVSSPTTPVPSDWQAHIHQATLLGWAQAKAIEIGPVGYGVVVDPTALKVNQQDFDLDLRLWKIEGTGKWWRDYTAHGVIQQKQKRLTLVGESVEETGKSKRAAIVDPLALLAEGFILDSISENLQQSLPLQHSKRHQQQKWQLNIESWAGAGDVLIVDGTVELTAEKSPAKKSK